MGNSSSNKAMVDTLVDQMSLSPRVESAFRAVDRGIYYETSDEKVDPYEQSPWRDGDLHISAPSIYAKVVEALDLKPGMSFLNLGSGTGYLSTVVGLLIAPQGVNHGVEVNDQVVKYAQRKLGEFLATSSAIDKFEFVEPTFIHGNCLDLNPEGQYDRVYLGADCIPAFEKFIKRLIKPDGGILVMPIDYDLVLYKRLADNRWERRILDPAVQFTSMLGPNHVEDKQMIEMPLKTVPELKKLSREAIRRQLRRKTDLMHPNLLYSDNAERRRHRRSVAMKRAAEERFLRQPTMKRSQSGHNSALRRSMAQCGYEMCSRASCRQKRLLQRPGVATRMVTRQTTRQLESAIWAGEMAGATSSSSYADIVSDLDGNTERDDDEDDDHTENAFLSNLASVGRLHQPRNALPSQSISSDHPTSSRAHLSVNTRESLTTMIGGSSRSGQAEIPRPLILAGQDSGHPARGDLDILMDPVLRSSIRRSRSFSPTLDGVRTAQSRLNQSIRDRNDRERIESALCHLMHRANRWRSPPLVRQQESDRSSPESALDIYWANPLNRSRHHQEEELDRVLLALYWTKFLKSALGDGSDPDDDDENDTADDAKDFLIPTPESSTESIGHSSSSSSSSSSLESDCPSNSSSHSTSSFASSDNDDCDTQDGTRLEVLAHRLAPSRAQAAEEPVASRLRSKRLHLSSEQWPSSSSGSAQPTQRSSMTKTKIVNRVAPKRHCCKGHQCFRRWPDTCHELMDQRQEQRSRRLAFSRGRELEPYAGCRHVSSTFMSGGANMSIEGRILLASGFNLRRTGASLSLINASSSVQQEMRQPILFMNAVARSGENWSAPSWESMNLCNCPRTFRYGNDPRVSSQQCLPQSVTRSNEPSEHREQASTRDHSNRRQQQQQLSYLGLIGCKRKRHSSESDSSERDNLDDDDTNDNHPCQGSPSELPGSSRLPSGLSAGPSFQDCAPGAFFRDADRSVGLARHYVCGRGSSSDARRCSSSVQGVAHEAPRGRKAALESCDSIKSTDDSEPLRPLAAPSLSSQATSGATLAANIDDGQPRPGAPLGSQPCPHHQQHQANHQHCHHHCRHHHKQHHRNAHCRHQRATLDGFAVASQRRRRGHHCKRHRCQRQHGRQTNHQTPSERPVDFHVRRRVERERRHTALQSGRSACSRRPARKPGNECDKYRRHISSYIRQLDLPAALLHYLNYDREFEF